MYKLLDEGALAERILHHIEHGTTDLALSVSREPVANYTDPRRLRRELTEVFHRMPVPFCPSAALAAEGAFLARSAAGTPLLAIRGADGQARVFRNACRHRGVQVAEGSGQAPVFVCPYHGWSYGLDGALRHVPHAHGFPGLEVRDHGLVPVPAIEHGGVLFVMQDGSGQSPQCREVRELPALLAPSLVSVSSNEQVSQANWKISAEGFIEGYHIKPTHRETFFPVQFDNLNVIEYFGRHSRVTYPYRNILKLRGVPMAERRVAGTLTHVYHLFPNAFIATFPRRTLLIVLEPVDVATTRTFTWTLAEPEVLQAEGEALRQDTSFVNQGAAEDRHKVESAQRGLASGGNTHFTFGRFEGAITHFHQQLHLLLHEASTASGV
jgi:phenylpropionate dioxygenase-like ring-hydroxylating dioxygenase large terminal subunit